MTCEWSTEHEKAVRLLRAGGVVIIPTDTVYGIAAHPDCAGAVARICTIKGRPIGKPIALLAADLASVLAFGAVLPLAARRLAERFWPGALTLVLPCGGGEEGFRVPDHPATRRVLAACGGTLRVTSANLSGAMPAVSAVDALRDVGLEADLVIDGGVCPGGVASSVVRVGQNGALEILRDGAIDAETLLRAAAGG
ncbi:MAG TPA: L-threonylcarbamoyladenylate synthase [Kiritimatiellia bacterium]|jgi:L-threonylcarbamoyladenylate synthase|nr:L-threonylcarbamoyladenylate synthase [Kiritimatiellia bacterium]HQQ92402.1 L-threonylcarbamoyladenylate synthase [Kiritimatiellia bacterium]